jgi:hypothetical protein
MVSDEFFLPKDVELIKKTFLYVQETRMTSRLGISNERAYSLSGQLTKPWNTTKRTREGWLKGQLAPFTSVDEGVESPLTEGGYYKNMFYLSSESLEKKWLFSMIKSMSEADLTWMLVLAPVVRLVSSVSAGRVDLCA